MSNTCPGSNVARPVDGYGGQKCPVCNAPVRNLVQGGRVIGKHAPNPAVTRR